MRLDGGLGVAVRVGNDEVEVTRPDGVMVYRIDQVLEVTARGGLLSRRGALEILLSDGETIEVPFTREHRSRAQRLRKRLRSMVRPTANVMIEAKRAEIEKRVEELRRRNSDSLEQRRQAIADQVARGVLGADAQEEFEREAARHTAAVEREAEEITRKFNETARTLGGNHNS